MPHAVLTEDERERERESPNPTQPPKQRQKKRRIEHLNKDCNFRNPKDKAKAQN